MLDVLLIYFMKPESPLYVLLLSILLWRISYEDLSSSKIDARLLLLLFLVGAFAYENAILAYLALCAAGSVSFCVFQHFCSPEEDKPIKSYIPYDLAGLALILLYYLLALPMPDALYRLAFLPLMDQTMWIFGVDLISVCIAAFLLGSHFQGDCKRKGIFYGVLFGLCNPFVSLSSMLIGHCIQYSKDRFEH
jgi:membrane protein